MVSLVALKQYLEDKQFVNLTNVSNDFALAPDHMRELLQHFVVKGQLSYQRYSANCGQSCHQCKVADTEIYCWQQGRCQKGQQKRRLLQAPLVG